MFVSIRSLLAAASVALLVPLAGCGTIINGSTQQVNVASTPSGAELTVNGLRNARTPALLDLARKNSHTLEFTLEGYESYQMQLTRSTSGWVWGNILFGGLIGLVVDASTGGMYKLTPEQVQAELAEAGRGAPGASGADIRVDDDRIYLFVTLEADADWEWVGQLDRQDG